MKVNTALLIIINGAGLLTLNYKKERITIALSLIAGAICLLILAEHFLNVNLHIDEWLFKDPDTNPLIEAPGRTSALSALTSLCLSFGMIAAVMKRFSISQLICTLTLILIYTALLGHIFGSAEFYRNGHYSGVAMHTALGFFLLNLGVLCYQSTKGWLRLFFEDSRGKYAFLYILIYLLFIAPLLVAFYLFMTHHNRFSPAAGVIILVVVSALISVPLTYLILNRTVRIDAELKKANQRLEIALTAANLGSYDLNLKDGSMYCTPQCKANFGLPPEAVFNFADLIAVILPEQREFVQNRINAAIANHTLYHAEYQARWPDGSIHWISASGKTQYKSNGEAVSIIGVTQDITTRKEGDLRKNDFIGMVSHELKTPLTSLKAFVQVLHGRTKKESREFESGLLVKVEHQITKMSTLINGFLNVSRLESGTIHLNKSAFDINELLQEIAEENRLMQTGHQIVVVPCPNVIVNADRDKIGQVINNLISNAIKYSSKGKQVSISCLTQNKQVQVSIKDEGIGIPKQYLGKLFDRYFRVDTPSTKHISGFGIGLYLSAEIIKGHGGSIWAESDSGKGSAFYFRLPV